MRTRFAPSPTGLLHVGNALSALLCQQWAVANQAALILRIEDIDYTRCRSEYIQAIRDDLSWLGLHWQQEAPLQSQRLSVYEDALGTLRSMEAIYPCFCTRAEFRAMQVYSSWRCPGDCIHLPAATRKQYLDAKRLHAWRLDRDGALARAGPLSFCCDEFGKSHHIADMLDHDPIIARKDIQYSYHLAVVLDDAEQGITQVIRGVDLWQSTAVHQLLQALLQLPSPSYHHHPLLLDHDGNRLAKQFRSTTIRELQQAGVQPSRLREFLLHEECRWQPDSVIQLTRGA